MFDSLPAGDYFFRDDDADRDVSELRRLLDLFEHCASPLSLAVIPGTLTAECAKLLADRWPAIEIHQHGWMHVNHEAGGRKCEFGPSRAFEEQRNDIERGQERLRSFIDARCAPIFTPPWNRCTLDTCHALTDLGFRALSKDQSPRFRQAGLPEMSISVDLFEWKPERRLKTAAQIAGEISDASGQGRPVGVLLHHKVMDNTAFALVEALVRCLRAMPETRLLRLGDACALAN
jgi:hypothetical protein